MNNEREDVTCKKSDGAVGAGGWGHSGMKLKQDKNLDMRLNKVG